MIPMIPVDGEVVMKFTRMQGALLAEQIVGKEKKHKMVDRFAEKWWFNMV